MSSKFNNGSSLSSKSVDMTEKEGDGRWKENGGWRMDDGRETESE
jgi:predicted secreted protein